MPGVRVGLHRDSEQDAFSLALALCGVAALAGATIQPPSLAESGFLAEIFFFFFFFPPPLSFAVNEQVCCADAYRGLSPSCTESGCSGAPVSSMG